MNTNRQILWNNAAASAAHLTGVGRVHSNKRNTSAFSLVFQHLPEYANPSIVRSKRKVRVSVHECECQVFNCNQVELIHKTPADLVEKIHPLVGNALMQSCDLPIRLMLPLTACDLPAGTALQSAKSRQAAVQPARVFNPLTCGEGGDAFQSNVNAHLFSCGFALNGRVRQFHLKGNIPALISSGDKHMLDFGVFGDCTVITRVLKKSYMAHIYTKNRLFYRHI